LKFLLPILVLLLAAAGAVAQAPHAASNTQYVDPALDVERMITRFESEGRELFALRDAIVAAAGIGPGDVVADVGAGTGAFMPPLVEAVGAGGHVYAVEISIRFVEHLRQVADTAGYGNVTVVHSAFTSATLAPASVDRMLVVDTYHHFDDHQAMLASMLAALRPGGVLTIVEFDRHDGAREWIRNHVRASKEVFRQEIEAAGFVFMDEPVVAGLQENFVARFRRP
jgi:ubiquinone/menaquinone biosynthesis C-methylase UbiE